MLCQAAVAAPRCAWASSPGCRTAPPSCTPRSWTAPARATTPRCSSLLDAQDTAAVPIDQWDMWHHTACTRPEVTAACSTSRPKTLHPTWMRPRSSSSIAVSSAGMSSSSQFCAPRRANRNLNHSSLIRMTGTLGCIAYAHRVRSCCRAYRTCRRLRTCSERRATSLCRFSSTRSGATSGVGAVSSTCGTSDM